MSDHDPWAGVPRPRRPERAADPDELRVIGLRRRAAVARSVNEVCRLVHVRAFEHGWTVSTISGYIQLCLTLEDLLEASTAASERGLLRATALAAADSAS
ncbi:hypothetical protein [Pseudonocardia endophytica]|uniref:Uncharacterized protein n=1 Tax=Pseudonocardia endophytica TaxID=401976 RepID=A0A4R1HII2_PSEEN|nr:hypothetical protein [Pseudonocardia endophytica]TCK20120.1 hypothetical protein EV378_4069 [Pseudonocardia endophytica]